VGPCPANREDDFCKFMTKKGISQKTNPQRDTLGLCFGLPLSSPRGAKLFSTSPRGFGSPFTCGGERSGYHCAWGAVRDIREVLGRERGRPFSLPTTCVMTRCGETAGRTDDGGGVGDLGAGKVCTSLQRGTVKHRLVSGREGRFFLSGGILRVPVVARGTAASNHRVLA
jgi:hypothetical protein